MSPQYPIGEFIPATPEGGRPWSRAARGRLYRGLALLLARLPRGDDTVLRIVRQRGGSKEDYGLALAALCQARVELREEMKSLEAKAGGRGKNGRSGAES